MFHKPKLTEADPIKIIKESYEDTIANENSKNYSEDYFFNISITDVKQGLDIAKKLQFIFLETDPSLSCKRTFQQNLKTCLDPYMKVLNTMENKRGLSSNINYENFSRDEFLLPRINKIWMTTVIKKISLIRILYPFKEKQTNLWRVTVTEHNN